MDGKVEEEISSVWFFVNFRLLSDHHHLASSVNALPQRRLHNVDRSVRLIA